MKKKVGWIIFALILVAFTGFYAVVDKNNGIYDREIDSSNYISVELKEGEKLSQSFVSKEDVLDGISVKMSVTGETEKKTVSYVLANSNGDTVASGKESLENLNLGKYFVLRFDKIEGCKNQEFTLQYSVSECDENGSVIVYVVPGTQEGTELVVKEESMEGALALRTITHRFDLETFIVTAIFLVYVILFVKWLGKVFK